MSFREMGWEAQTPPTRHSVANPIGYPWRVAPLQSPLPFHRSREACDRFFDPVKRKNLACEGNQKIVQIRRFQRLFSLVTFFGEATGPGGLIVVDQTVPLPADLIPEVTDRQVGQSALARFDSLLEGRRWNWRPESSRGCLNGSIVFR